MVLCGRYSAEPGKRGINKSATEAPARSCTVFTKHAKLRDHYDLAEASTKDTLGTGSYGSVYKCSHKTTGAVRAVKAPREPRVSWMKTGFQRSVGRAHSLRGHAHRTLLE